MRRESWLELELRLMLVGCEEARRPGLRACRDRRRPLIWDRQLATALAIPEAPERDLAALDAWYRDGGAARWSVVAPEGPIADAWARTRGAVESTPATLLYFEGEATERADPGPVLRPGPTDGLATLARFRRELARERGEDPGALPEQLSGALGLRFGLGWVPRVLATLEGEELASVMVWSANGTLGWMEDLETRDRFRGRGHGRRLLGAALADLARTGVRRVGFSAREADWPWRWYQRLGFRVVERAQRFERLL